MQKKVFVVLMAIFMVYGMEVYNGALRQGSLTADLLLPTWEVIYLVPTVIVLQTCFGGPAAGWLQNKLTHGREYPPHSMILLRQLCTVLFMCPAMSLVAVFVFKGGLQTQFLQVWGLTVLMNAPMALSWQILAAGPAVRFLVSWMTKNHIGQRHAV